MLMLAYIKSQWITLSETSFAISIKSLYVYKHSTLFSWDCFILYLRQPEKKLLQDKEEVGGAGNGSPWSPLLKRSKVAMPGKLDETYSNARRKTLFTRPPTLSNLEQMQKGI